MKYRVSYRPSPGCITGQNFKTWREACAFAKYVLDVVGCSPTIGKVQS